VITLAVSAAGTVYAGGNFRNVGDGITRRHLAAFDASGAVIEQWDPNLDDWAQALQISGNTIHVAGHFLHVRNAPSTGLAAIDATTGALTPGWQDPHIVGGAHALVADGGTVYAAGGTVEVDGVDRFNLFAFDAHTGEVNRGWDPGLNGFALALAVSDHTVYVGGDFDEVNIDESGGGNPDAIRRNRLAAFPALDEDGNGSANAAGRFGVVDAESAEVPP
jgi:hypothetical protein